MSNSTPEQWGVAAKTYPQTGNIGKPSSLPNATETLFSQMDLAHPISQGSAILDVGSGPGTCLARLIDTFGSQLPPTTRLIASDFSEGMAKQVRERRNMEQVANALWRRVEVKVLDAQELEGIEDGSISHITGTHVYNLVADGRKALQAALRVLKPGGVVGMTTIYVAEWMELMALAARKIRGDDAPEFKLPVSFSTVEGIRGEFKRIGLEEVFVEEVDSYMDVTDPSSIINSFIRGGNPGALMFVGDYSEEEMDRFVEEWLRLIRERHPKEPRMLKGVSIVAIGKK